MRKEAPSALPDIAPWGALVRVKVMVVMLIPAPPKGLHLCRPGVVQRIGRGCAYPAQHVSTVARSVACVRSRLQRAQPSVGSHSIVVLLPFPHSNAGVGKARYLFIGAHHHGWDGQYGTCCCCSHGGALPTLQLLLGMHASLTPIYHP